MNEQEIFNNIKSRIDNMTKQVYSDYSITPISRTKQVTMKQSTYEPDIALLKHRMSTQKPIGTVTIDNMKKHETSILNINEEVAVVMDKQDHDMILWKNLETDVKLVKFNEYFEKTEYTNFPDHLYKRLITMIIDGKLDKKKYINYNEEYKRIYDVPIINYDANIQEYYLRSDRESKKKKISKIFK